MKDAGHILRVNVAERRRRVSGAKISFILGLSV